MRMALVELGLIYFILIKKKLQLTVMTTLWTAVLRMNSNWFNIKLSIVVVFKLCS